MLMARLGCISDALYPAAYGVALAIITTWSRNYLLHRTDALLAGVNAHADTPGTLLGSRCP